MELRYPRHVGNNGEAPGVIEDFFLFEPFRSEEMAKSASEGHLFVNMLFAKLRFLAVAEWFVRHQEWDGSWRVPVKRVFTREIYLSPGWCSAMGQGTLDFVYSLAKWSGTCCPNLWGPLNSHM